MKRLLLILSVLCLISNASTAAENMFGLRTSFAETVKTASPAVVNIFTEKQVASNNKVNPFSNDPFFNRYMSGNMEGHIKKRIERSLGSGVVVTEDGYIVTNYHVISNASSIRVVFNDNKEYAAEFIAADKNTDIAVMRIILEEDQEATFDFVGFADSDAVEIGDIVLVLGNPYGVGQSVSMGIVSATGRSKGTGHYENLIQTDAAINPGNSGGALVDSEGKLVGVSTAIYSKSGGSQGIGFAIPANSVRVTLNSVLTTGKITRPWFGANGQDISTALAKQLELSKPTGVLINEIVPASPAEKSNLEIGDIILNFAGHNIENMGQLNARVASSFVGEVYELGVWREGKNYITEIMLGALPDRRIDEQYTVRGSNPLDGFTFEPLSPSLSDDLHMPLNSEGIIVVATPSKKGFGMVDLIEGDILVSVNKKSIITIKDLQTAVSRRPQNWQIIYKRGDKIHKVMVQ